MKKINKNIFGLKKKFIVSFDLEWTKNYKIKNGNKPFCFSFIYFDLCYDISRIEEEFDFGVIARYVESEGEIPKLIYEANKILGNFINSEIMLIGHQLSSDIGVLINCNCDQPIHNFLELRHKWKNRKRVDSKNKSNMMSVFDTRYDSDPFVIGKSRRLVDVCVEYNLDVYQPEIMASMTKMQNEFFKTKNSLIREKLTILNIRHSLAAGLLYMIFKYHSKPQGDINVNKIIYKNLRDNVNYLNFDEFKMLI